MQETRISGGMLLLARKRRLMTQTALSEATGLPQTLVSRLENNLVTSVSHDQLQRIATALSFPVSLFEPHGEDTYKQPLSLHSTAFRKAASSSQKKVDFSVALANHYVLQIRKLLEAVDLEPQLTLPTFEIADQKSGILADNARSVNSPEDAARKVRQAWQLPPGPIENLTGLAEACGIVVVHADFQDVDVDGMTIRPTGLRPVILLNRDRPACRQRFSLAHEIGHVILHSFHTEDMEVEANRFASELLMPSRDILPDLKTGLSIPRLGQLKLKWRTSMGALLYRAKTLGVLSDFDSKSLWISMSSAGYRTREPEEFDVPRERPRTFRSLINLHVDDLGYSLNEIAWMVDTNIDEFLSMADMQTNTQERKKAIQLRVVVDNSNSN